MTVVSHLIELRKRALLIGLSIVIGAVFGWLLSDWMYNMLAQPLSEVAAKTDRQTVLNFDTITIAFDLRMQIAITIGICVASPFWIYQIGAFVLPGLMRRERAYVLGFLGAAVPLFLVGAYAGWLIMPHVVNVLVAFAPPDSQSNLAARTYYEFVMKLVVATGIAFVLPVLLVAMNFAGMLQGKTILKGWRIAIVASAAFAAFVTPAADPLSMFLLMIPMMILYFGAAGIAVGRDRIVKRRLDQLLEVA